MYLRLVCGGKNYFSIQIGLQNLTVLNKFKCIIV